MDWQTIVAVVLVVLSAAWALRMLLASVLPDSKPGKSGHCSGCCACSRGEGDAESKTSPHDR